MFQMDIDSLGSNGQQTTPCPPSSRFASFGGSSGSNKRNSADMSSGGTMRESTSSFDAQFNGFYLGTGTQGRYQASERSQRRNNSRRSRR
ncbi:uncharacterized protein LOC120169706 [Hibiscus syriacus]|uniref:uncharacterized protein LOC120169706 n=1 Tax=Hibiscus syriacus TaxID=106335 RepID=UPI0019235870|nr:uncharacterized protein LOC120169706 [Hibiscus syriacus]XP_039033759.1 uncharacterized protein LOC120169706 [Hibiscus syriacus]